MKVLLVTLALLAPAIVEAQSTITRGPVPPTARLVWDAPDNVTSVADAQALEARLYINGTPATAVTGVTCAQASPSVITCSAPISQSNLDAINRFGRHNLTLSMFRADVGEGPQSDPFALVTSAGAPKGLRVQP